MNTNTGHFHRNVKLSSLLFAFVKIRGGAKLTHEIRKFANTDNGQILHYKVMERIRFLESDRDPNQASFNSGATLGKLLRSLTSGSHICELFTIGLL